jgi:hypothetical protein
MWLWKKVQEVLHRYLNLNKQTAQPSARPVQKRPVSRSPVEQRDFMPDHLYKYRYYNAYSLSSLANSPIWLSEPKTFNDPFDCAITLDRNTYKKSVIDAISVALKKVQDGKTMRDELLNEWPGDGDAFETLRNSVKDLFQNIGICSFSALSDHMLMWSHYADHHKGFCILSNLTL